MGGGEGENVRMKMMPNFYIMQDSSLNTTTMKDGFHAYTVCANYLRWAFVSYMARVGNGRHLFAVANKSASKNLFHNVSKYNYFFTFLNSFLDLNVRNLQYHPAS
jgi:hypothetical protein